jgi:GT2 family glycosyltransferase
VLKIVKLKSGAKSRNRTFALICLLFLGGHAVRKGVFEKCGLCRKDFLYGSEDLYLSYRMIQNGYKIFYASDVIVDHYQRYLSPLSRLAGLTGEKYLYFTIGNKIWIDYKYLPVGLQFFGEIYKKKCLVSSPSTDI